MPASLSLQLITHQNSSKHGTVTHLHTPRPRFLRLHRWSLPLNTTGISSPNAQPLHSYCLVPLQNHHAVLPALLPLPRLAPGETLRFRSWRPVFPQTFTQGPGVHRQSWKAPAPPADFHMLTKAKHTPENRFLETNFTRPCACPPSQPGISAT